MFYRHSGPIGPATEFWVTPVGRGPVPRMRFSCLNQDGQDVQDLQDGGRLGIRPKGLEDLNVYSISRNERLRSDRTLICTAAAGVHARDRPSRYGGRGMRFFS